MKSNGITSYGSAKGEHIRLYLIKKILQEGAEQTGGAGVLSAASGAEHALADALSTIG